MQLVSTMREWSRRIPEDAIRLCARFAMAAVFWQAGQTKVSGFQINFVYGEWGWGWPVITPQTWHLFATEYQLPLMPAVWAAVLAVFFEHIFSAALLLGLATRAAALGLLGMTVVIQLFVYPDAYATHATWTAVLLYLLKQGGGRFSVDHWVYSRYRCDT